MPFFVLEDAALIQTVIEKWRRTGHQICHILSAEVKKCRNTAIRRSCVNRSLVVVRSLDSKQKRGRILFARHRSAEKRIRDLCYCTPITELEAAIVKDALRKV
jgi:hypothetical protein